MGAPKTLVRDRVLREAKETVAEIRGSHRLRLENSGIVHLDHCI